MAQNSGTRTVTRRVRQIPQSFSKVLADGLYKKYNKIVVTQDFHPANHCSFVEQGGVFPPHCVQNTEGVNVYPKLQEVLDNTFHICRLFCVE